MAMPVNHTDIIKTALGNVANSFDAIGLQLIANGSFAGGTSFGSDVSLYFWLFKA